MNNHDDFDKSSAYALYVSQEHSCSYLQETMARTLFLDPAAKVDADLYQQLIDRGFRRSGGYLYQPACAQCEACVSLRLPAGEFQPDRSQRRNWRRNRQRISVIPRPAQYQPEHFDLYCRYQADRHADGAMACSDPRQYMGFLTCDWADTRFFEFRREGELLAVAVTDLLPRGLSSIYTFFDPASGRDGLGVFALLWQIHHAAELGKPWVYPGFWIAGSAKMSYKSRYRPLEAWTGQTWRRFGTHEPLVGEV